MICRVRFRTHRGDVLLDMSQEPGLALVKSDAQPAHAGPQARGRGERRRVALPGLDVHQRVTGRLGFVQLLDRDELIEDAEVGYHTQPAVPLVLDRKWSFQRQT